MRKHIIAGNWKMNLTPRQSAEFAQELLALLDVDLNAVEVVVAPTFVSLHSVANAIQGSKIGLAAQNLHYEEKGAFTGEVSAQMLAESGCNFVIVGHSERRQLFGESDQTVNLKLKAALAAGLSPILCIGESLEERESNQTIARVKQQLQAGLEDLADNEVAKLVIAYEPIWAIGTGKTASTEQAQEVHAFIRAYLTESHGASIAQSMRIQYGGSVNAKNAADLLGQPDIDGALVGGASLKADSFAAIVRAALTS